MKIKGLAGIGLAMGVAFGNAACTTTSIVPKVTNINATDEATCLIIRARGFDPGILPLIGYQTSDTTRTDAVCVTRQTAQQLIMRNDIFLRTVGYETYKLLPGEAQQQVQQFLMQNGTSIENIAASVPQVEQTVINCRTGMVELHGHMPNGQKVVDIKPIVNQEPANQNSVPAALSTQCPAQP